jgi:acetoin utilization protein AcuB
MLVRERMTPNPITITPDRSVPDALRLMRQKKVRRLPVLDGRGELIGIVSDKDLLYVAPSPATTLAIWEIPELLAKLEVERVMTREVVTVSEDAPLEEAARIMVDSRVGGLPVMRGKTLVGIITETDLFKVFLELLGGRRSGVRVTVSTSGAKGTVARTTSAIFGVGGDIVGLGVNEVKGAAAGTQWHITLKVQDVPRDRLVEAVRPVVNEILDVRET